MYKCDIFKVEQMYVYVAVFSQAFTTLSWNFNDTSITILHVAAVTCLHALTSPFA